MTLMEVVTPGQLKRLITAVDHPVNDRLSSHTWENILVTLEGPVDQLSFWSNVNAIVTFLELGMGIRG
jgi:hypothetical protein